jgi:hypothetical protein
MKKKIRSFETHRHKLKLRLPYCTSTTNKINPFQQYAPTQRTGLLNVSVAPVSARPVTAPSMQFHTKLNRFQQLAYLLVTISEILSKAVLLEMGFKNEKLQYTLQKFVGFI